MGKSAAHTVQSSFLAGVREGQKDAREGDFTFAAIGLAVILILSVLAVYLGVRGLRWLIR